MQSEVAARMGRVICQYLNNGFSDNPDVELNPVPNVT